MSRVAFFKSVLAGTKMQKGHFAEDFAWQSVVLAGGNKISTVVAEMRRAIRNIVLRGAVYLHRCNTFDFLG